MKIFRNSALSMLAAAASVLAPSAHANLLVSSFATNQVIQYNGTTGAFIGAFVTAGTGGLSGPMGLAYNGGNLFVAAPYGDLAVCLIALGATATV